jgi:hypothetical protein
MKMIYSLSTDGLYHFHKVWFCRLPMWDMRQASDLKSAQTYNTHERFVERQGCRAVSIHSWRRRLTIWRGESMLSMQRTVSVDIASIDGVDYVWTLLKTKLLEGSVLWIQVVVWAGLVRKFLVVYLIVWMSM